MKNIKLIYILLIFIGLVSCKAQQTVASLYEMEQCNRRLDKTKECTGMDNITHVKDIGNRLGAFVGTWKGLYGGMYGGLQIELNLEKKIDFGDDDLKWDKLMGKIKVKDNQGNIIFNSFNNPDTDINPYGYNFQGSAYEMGFWANGNCFDEGTIFVEMLPQTSNNPLQMRFIFIRAIGFETNDNLLTACPNFNSYQTLLPNKVKITLTKQ